MKGTRIAATVLLVATAPLWLSGYWALVSGNGFLPPAANDGIEFFRVMLGMYGFVMGSWMLLWE